MSDNLHKLVGQLCTEYNNPNKSSVKTIEFTPPPSDSHTLRLKRDIPTTGVHTVKTTFLNQHLGEGNYVTNKYLKYKQKYLALKNQLNN
jgi:hypothetical protein